MEEKKHIDRLFQEKLKDFEAKPGPEVWNAIEQRLTKKKKKRIVPLWLRYGSAAAVLLFLASSAIWVFNNDTSVEDPIIPEPVIINNKNIEPKSNDTDGVLVKDTNKQLKKEESSNKSKTESIYNSDSNKTETANNKVKGYSKEKASSVKQVGERLADNFNEEQKSTTEKQERVEKTEKNVKPILDQQEEENTLAYNQEDNKLLKSKDIAEAIEDNLKNKEKEDDKTFDRWSVGTNISPIYFNSVGEGSPINKDLALNEKSYNTSLSYGVKVNYALNDRLSIQSGVNSVELAYSTKDVSALIHSSDLRLENSNINTNINGVSLTTMSNRPSASDNSELAPQRGVLNLRGNLDQSMSYVEIPLEAKYALTKTKLGVNVIGGVSTYILYNNSVALSNQNGNTTLGEASNLNDVNFSGNLGLDLDYEINKKLYINVSPMFKYQVNTFSKNDGGFKPYYIGVYTGLNFRF